MGLGLAHPLPNAVPFVLGDGAQDGEHQLADTVAVHVAPEVDHVQTDAVFLQLLKGAERISRGAEGAIQLGRDHDVAPFE